MGRKPVKILEISLILSQNDLKIKFSEMPRVSTLFRPSEKATQEKMDYCIIDKFTTRVDKSTPKAVFGITVPLRTADLNHIIWSI